MFQDSDPSLSNAMPTPMLFVLAFGVAAVVSLFAGAVSTPKHALVGLVLVGVACTAVGRRGAGPRAALVVGPVFWLFFDAFVEHHDGTLGWSGAADALNLAALTALAALPLALRAVHSLWTARRRFRRAGLEWFEPEMPERKHPSAWN